MLSTLFMVALLINSTLSAVSAHNAGGTKDGIDDAVPPTTPGEVDLLSCRVSCLDDYVAEFRSAANTGVAATEEGTTIFESCRDTVSGIAGDEHTDAETSGFAHAPLPSTYDAQATRGEEEKGDASIGVELPPLPSAFPPPPQISDEVDGVDARQGVSPPGTAGAATLSWMDIMIEFAGLY